MPALQFGQARPGLDYRHRPTAFGLVVRDGLLACVRVERGAASYIDLPGGAVDGVETEAQALVREFREETGLTVAADERLFEAAQYLVKTDGSAVNNAGGYWTAALVAENPADKCENDHALMWLKPEVALTRMRHDAHAWAVAAWIRREQSGGATGSVG